ncbi:unnamed protein product [Cochlearia groenlandica]
MNLTGGSPFTFTKAMNLTGGSRILTTTTMNGEIPSSRVCLFPPLSADRQEISIWFGDGVVFREKRDLVV